MSDKRWKWYLGAAKPHVMTEEDINRLAKETGTTVEAVRESLEYTAKDLIFMNEIYQVNCRLKLGKPPILHLSIKRRDKLVIHEWRDLQRIKNEIAGPEYEAIELYPAESRVVDTANQYHLWVGYQPEMRFPVGWDGGRSVKINDSYGGSKQNPLKEVQAIKPLLEIYGHLLQNE